MNRITNCLAVAAFAFAAFGMNGEAHANEIRIRLDNYLNPSGYGSAAGDGTMTVCIVTDDEDNGDDGVMCDDLVLDDVESSHDYYFDLLGSEDYLNVLQVSLHYHGAAEDITDLLIIDQIEVWSTSGTDHLRDTFGVDNEEGYCFSSQSGDFSNSHCGTLDILAPANQANFFPSWT